MEKMGADIIPSKLDEVLKKLMNDDRYFDLERLRTFIERYKLNLISSLDNFPHEALAAIIIRDFLYGKDHTDVSIIVYRLLDKYICDNNQFLFVILLAGAEIK